MISLKKINTWIIISILLLSIAISIDWLTKDKMDKISIEITKDMNKYQFLYYIMWIFSYPAFYLIDIFLIIMFYFREDKV